MCVVYVEKDKLKGDVINQYLLCIICIRQVSLVVSTPLMSFLLSVKGALPGSSPN